MICGDRRPRTIRSYENIQIVVFGRPIIKGTTISHSNSFLHRLTPSMVAVSCIVLARIVIYFVAAPNYGYFRDEMYYLACGEHPAWGYIDQPPLIAWMAWLLEHTIGVSLYAMRLLPMLADVGCIVMTALLARKLGGGFWAMLLSSLAVLVAPISLTLSQLFTMNAFDPLLWIWIAWLLVDLVQTGKERNWLWIGVLTGVTLLKNDPERVSIRG